ncbi:hypothetical protein KW795_02030 [Candidatus Microgenomates bacterium]|nr:hypothetical protein [Candidatus Microgenomates bacterium]
MMIAILLILLVFWLLGYGPIVALRIPLFAFNGRVVNLWDILIFVIIMYLVSALPRPFREIASVLLVLWVLAIFGIIAIANFSNIVIVALVVGLLAYILSGR